MELHKALKDIVACKGAEMIKDIQIINYLLDYQAFKEKPATKQILRDVIINGYAEKIIVLETKDKGWENRIKHYQYVFAEKFGYKEELVAFVFESIAYGLGKIRDFVFISDFSINKVEKEYNNDENGGDFQQKNSSDFFRPKIYSEVLPLTREVCEFIPKWKYFCTFYADYYAFLPKNYYDALPQLQEMGIVSREWKQGWGYPILVYDKNQLKHLIYNSYPGTRVPILEETKRWAMRLAGKREVKSSFFTHASDGAIDDLQDIGIISPEILKTEGCLKYKAYDVLISDKNEIKRIINSL